MCGATLKGQGYLGLIVKANQGTAFVDQTAVPMVASARQAGLATGLYDFDSTYTIAEAQLLVARAKAMGILPHSTNSLGLWLDVEYGNFSTAGLNAQIAYLRSQGYRPGIYTGDWYWAPHAGCVWPASVPAWLSGYPSAIVPCGLPASLFVLHQYTSSPVDKSVFLGTATAFQAFTSGKPPPPAAQVANATLSVRIVNGHWTITGTAGTLKLNSTAIWRATVTLNRQTGHWTATPLPAQ